MVLIERLRQADDPASEEEEESEEEDQLEGDDV